MLNAVKQLLLLTAGLCAAAQFVSAQTWTQNSAPTNVWVDSVVMSADGTKLVAASAYTPNGQNGQGGFTDGGGIFTSTNSGSTWVATIAPSNFWNSVASSAEGTKLAAAGSDLSLNGVIYTSTNSGATWTQANGLPPNIYYYSIASSADGTKLAVIIGDHSVSNYIYTSTNSGATWAQNIAPVTNYTSIALSADGTKLVAVVNSITPTGMGGPIFISTNSGSTWTQASAISGQYAGWQYVASSADGSKLAAVDFNHIFVSADSGNTWTQTIAPHTTWSSIASSADGAKLIASTVFQPPYVIYTSTDSGTTWTSNSIPNQQEYVVASSADGSKLFAAATRGGIWTSQTTRMPQLNITPTNYNLTLSWIIPSTNFVLQQNLDLTTTNWTDVTNTPVLNLTNLQNQVFLPPPGSNVFYRLKTP